MPVLDGVWRLVECRAWDEQGNSIPSPYGTHPMGQITFSQGRMLAALCNGDPQAPAAAPRTYSSYGGPYNFDGHTLETVVDVSSDPARIGSRQVRSVEGDGTRMVMRPPQRTYGGSVQRRELVWERIWQPT